MTGTFGQPCLAKDGHYCDSMEEAAVDNYLYDLRIPHSRNPCYPHSRLRADWWIPETNILIEYFGLVGQPDYDAKIELKRELARYWGLNLVEIYPEDLHMGGVKQILIQRVANALDELPSESPLVQEQTPLLMEVKALLQALRLPSICDVIIQEDIYQTEDGEVIPYFKATTPGYWTGQPGDRRSSEALEEETAVKSIMESHRERLREHWRSKLEGMRSRAENLRWCGKELKGALEEARTAIDRIEVKPYIIRSWNDLSPNHPIRIKKQKIIADLQSIGAHILQGFRVIISKRRGGYVALRPGFFFSHQFKPAIRASTKEQTLEMVGSVLKEARQREIDKLLEEARSSLPWPEDLELEFNKVKEVVGALDRYIWVAEGGRIWWGPFTRAVELEQRASPPPRRSWWARLLGR